jgi:hypothetical protein
LRQVRCGRCSRFKFPQELHRTELIEVTGYRTKRDAQLGVNPVTIKTPTPICLECAAKESP